MNPSSDLRSFSSRKHADGQWNTASVALRWSPLRRCATYLSFKRALIDKFSIALPQAPRVLEVGCGVGSYARWLLSAQPSARVVAIDWSLEALRTIPSTTHSALHLVCADAHHLPFKTDSFDGAYSVDTFGHLHAVSSALREIARTTRRNAPIAFHSECRDYRSRWPDVKLIAQLGSDIPAEIDGHYFLHSSQRIQKLYSVCFCLSHFYSPAGLMGWLLGYPEKYLPAFVQSRWYGCIGFTALSTVLKRLPLIGLMLRFVNVTTNHLELVFNLTGGGSCFALGHVAKSPPKEEP
jgi:ubiquinone/menaquinone biosynthesis C-methylase UbiE